MQEEFRRVMKCSQDCCEINQNIRKKSSKAKSSGFFSKFKVRFYCFVFMDGILANLIKFDE